MMSEQQLIPGQQTNMNQSYTSRQQPGQPPIVTETVETTTYTPVDANQHQGTLGQTVGNQSAQPMVQSSMMPSTTTQPQTMMAQPTMQPGQQMIPGMNQQMQPGMNQQMQQMPPATVNVIQMPPPQQPQQQMTQQPQSYDKEYNNQYSHDHQKEHHAPTNDQKPSPINIEINNIVAGPPGHPTTINNSTGAGGRAY